MQFVSLLLKGEGKEEKERKKRNVCKNLQREEESNMAE